VYKSLGLAHDEPLQLEARCSVLADKQVAIVDSGAATALLTFTQHRTLATSHCYYLQSPYQQHRHDSCTGAQATITLHTAAATSHRHCPLGLCRSMSWCNGRRCEQTLLYIYLHSTNHESSCVLVQLHAAMRAHCYRHRSYSVKSVHCAVCMSILGPCMTRFTRAALHCCTVQFAYAFASLCIRAQQLHSQLRCFDPDC
jgi:hypothetical protein